MGNKKILVLGSSGFVGGNIANIFQEQRTFDTITTARTSNAGNLHFDLLDQSSWHTISEIKPDYIIDATGYGVVKEQTNLELLYKINYLVKRSFIEFIFKALPNVFWLQIGTAFEYSLEQERLTEKSLCLPTTHYGISKSLFSLYLTNTYQERYCIIRPFGMFGEREDTSKFFPMLILAQKEKKAISLSDGTQYRDYFYVNDFSNFLYQLIYTDKVRILECGLINVGSGIPRSLRQLSFILSAQIPDFDPTLWNWGKVAQRVDENNLFYNASTKAVELGFQLTSLDEAFQKTIKFYYNN